MGKILLLAHISLDGFVAGVHGELSNFQPGEENLQFVCDLTLNADAALFGRKSYELLNTYWPTAKDDPYVTPGTVAYSNWYNSATKIIVSKSKAGQQIEKGIIVSDEVVNSIKSIKTSITRDILMFGSPSVTQLLVQHDLIDEYWIFVNPVLFGKGIPLFSSDADLKKLKHVSTVPFANGEIALQYSRE